MTKQELAVVTLVHRDHWLLRRWIEYYAKHLEQQNIYVLLHGADPIAEAIAEGCNLFVLPRNGFPNAFSRQQTLMLNAFSNFLTDSYKTVIVSDIDEMVVVDPGKHSSLKEFAAMQRNAGEEVSICMGMELHPNKSCEQIFVDDQMILQQRHHAICSVPMCKPSMIHARVNFARGMHRTQTQSSIKDGLFLFHVPFANEHIALSRSNEKQDMSLELEDASSYAHWSENHDKTDRIYESLEWKGVTDLDTSYDDLRNHLNDNAFVGGKGWFNIKQQKPRFRRIYRIPERFFNEI